MANTASTSAKGPALPSREARLLDSPMLEEMFLSAVGLQAPRTYSRPNPQADPVPHPRPADPGANPMSSNPPGNDVRGQAEMPSTSTSTQWTRTKRQPAPLSNTYWDAQRIAAGIADPSRYPQPSRQPAGPATGQWQNKHVDAPWEGNQVARQKDGKLEEDPSAGRREVAPHHWAANPADSRSRGPIANPTSWVQPNTAKPTSRPGISKTPVPTNANQWTKEPDNHPRGRGEGANKPPNDGAGRQQGPPAGLLQIDQLSPDLTAHRMPRPDRNYAGSTYSLPSLGSGINVSITGMGGRSTADQSSVDIRNTIGLHPNIHQAGDSWTTYNWADPWGRDNNETLCSRNYLAAFITAWMKQITDTPQTSFDQGVPDHWRCDIDTLTGRLLQPICQPESMTDHSRIDQQLEWRRQNWTSALLMRRNMGPRGHGPGHKGRLNPRGRGPYGAVSNFQEWPEMHHSSANFEGPAALDERMIVEVHEPVIERPEYQHFVPRIPCYLRPAAKHDMEGICRIYNLEMERGLQALDTEPLTVEDFNNILTTAQQLGMPFVVAVSGSARELGLTKGNLAFSAFRQMPSHGPDSFGEILGFGFLSVWQPGLAGTGGGPQKGAANGTSRATARMNVFVHPDYRRRKIGFSLLDMLLTTVSDRFSSESGYDFIDATNSPVYKNSRDHKRQHFRLYISYLVKSKLRTDGNAELEKEQEAYDNDLVWIKKLLEDRLNFTELVRFENVHRTAKGRVEPVRWLDEVVFEHSCLFDPLIVKADY